MASSNALTTRFAADINQFEREIRRMQNLNTRAAARIAADQARAAQRAARAWNDNDPSKILKRQFSGARDEIKRFAPYLAAAFGGSEVSRSADTWTRFTNQLKVAGFATYELKNVQEELYAISQKNGVGIEATGMLYARTASSAQALGLSQQEVMKFTSAVSTAIRAQGGSSEEANSAIVQLSQGISDTTLQWEDMASVLDNAAPLLDAVSAGSDKWGNSNVKLRKALKANEVASVDFVKAVLAGSGALDEMASKSTTTLAQSLTILSNAFTKYVGEANQANGATLILVNAIKALADNLPTVINALMVLAGVYMASLVPGIARATTAFVANTVAAATSGAVYNVASRQILLGASAMNTARMAATGLTAMLGGPFGIALAAVTAGMTYWAFSTAQANQKTADLRQKTGELADKLGLHTDAANKAASATSGVSKASVIAGAKARGLAIDIESLTNKYQLLAEAARQSAVDIARTSVIDAQQRYEKRKADAEAAPFLTTVGRDPMDRRGGNTRPQPVKKADALAELEKSPEALALKQARAVLDELKKPESRAAFVDKPAKPDAPEDKKKGSKASAKAAPSDGTDELRNLEIERLQLVLQDTHDLARKLEIQRAILELQAQGRIEAINQQVAAGQITKSAGEALKAKQQQIATEERVNLAAEHAREMAERKARIGQEETALAAETLRSEADYLDDRARYAKTATKRHDYELQALEKRQEADRLEFDVRRKQYEADLQLLGLSRDRIDAMLAQMDKNFDADQGRETDNTIRDQSKDDPGLRGRLGEHADSFGTLNAQLGNIATDGLDNLTNGLTDAIMGAKSLKEAFTDMAKSMIAQLIQMAIRFVIFETLGRAFGVSGLGASALGISKQSTPGVSIGKNAKGTNRWGGGLTMVGEKGPELLMLPGGSQIGPNNLLSSALQQSAKPMSAGGNSIQLVTHINAQDAVLTSAVKGWIQDSQIQSIQAAQKIINRDQAKRSRNTLYR